jgi:GntR family transcriptional regulator
MTAKNTPAEKGAGKLRRLETRPLSERVKDTLLESIAGGEFLDGRLPSEERLAIDLGVSRTTLREALQSLEEAGLVSRQHGVGTRVNYHVARAIALNRVIGFHELIREAGYTPTIQWTRVCRAAGTADAARRLGRPEGSPLLLVERLFLADRTAAIHLVEKIPEDVVERPFEADDVPDSIFAFAETFCRSPIDHSVVEIIPIVADTDVVAHLPLTVGDPLIRLIETHYSPDGEPLIVSVIHVNDHVLRFSVVRKRA